MTEAARHSLERFYALQGNLPEELVDRVIPKPSVAIHQHHSSSVPNTRRATRDEHAIADLLKDPRITLEQREQISTAILNGRFEVLPAKHAPPRIIPKDVEKQRIAELTVKRHRLPKQNFLEIITQTTQIPVLSGKDVHANRIAVQKRMGSPSPDQRNEFNNTRGTDESGFPSRVGTAKERSMKDIQNELIAEHNRKRMERSKREAKVKTEQAAQLKALEQAGAEKRMEVKRKLQEVRKSLRAHLMNNRDPQLGTIMRCVDESLIYHFMEKYKGFSMSVQAILSLVGNSLGTQMINPAIPNEDGEEDAQSYHSDDGDRSPDNQRYGATDRITSRISSQVVPKRHMTDVDFDDSRNNTPVASASHTGGRKATSPGHNRALLDSESSVASIKKLVRSRGTLERDSLSGGRSGSGKGNRTGMSDAVTGITPRKYHADRPISPSNKAWGGGFRVNQPHAEDAHSPNKPLANVNTTRPSSLPANASSTDRFTPSNGDRKLKSANQARAASGGGSTSQPQCLVLFGSENLRRTAQEMGFTASGPHDFNDELFSDRPDENDADAQSIFSHHSVASNDSYHTSVPSNAIAAMHDQLVEENTLPSMQPEIVLSQSQIEELGLHKKTFNQIMKEISKHNSFKSSESVEETDAAMFSQTPHLSHYGGTDTTSAEPITDSMPPSPKTPNGIERSIPSSGNLNKMVTNLMTTATVVKTLFVQPLSDTADVPPPPKSYISLYGSIYTDADKERFQHLGALEIARGEQRHGIEPVVAGGSAGSPHRISMSRPYEGTSPDKFPKLAALTKPPIAIKTKAGPVDEQNNPMPVNPYPTFEEQCRIQSTGVPAGAGYMLWRPRYRVSREGRYRAGQSHTKLRHSVSSGPVKKPFVSSA